jgi:hypothetical protein
VHTHYAHAQSLASGSGLLTARLARLALLTLRPNDALELLEPALWAPGGSALLPLYDQALIAARRFAPMQGAL